MEKLKKNYIQLKALPFTLLRCVPDEFRDYVKMCLNYTPDLRPDANQFTKVCIFYLLHIFFLL